MQASADFAVLQFACEDGALWPIAVLLLDDQDRLHVRARPSAQLATRIPPQDVEVFVLSIDQIAEDARATNGREVLEALEDRLSNTIRITDCSKTHISNIQSTLDDLYERYITSGE